MICSGLLLLTVVGLLVMIQTKPNMNDLAQFIGLAGALATVILGGVAIWLSLYFYEASSSLHGQLTTIMSRIEASSKAAEQASTDVLAPTMKMILGVVQESLGEKIGATSSQMIGTVAEKLRVIERAGTEPEREAARKALFESLDKGMRSLKHNIGSSLQIAPEVEQRNEATQLARLAPVGQAPRIDWLAFIRRLRSIQENNHFVSVRRLKTKSFEDEPAYQDAVQVALDRGILVTYRHPNPKIPEHPTLACKLNPDNEIVRACLEKLDAEDAGT